MSSTPLPRQWPDAWPYPHGARPVTAREAAVATTDRYATRVGLEVLQAGGNAVDAAVAVSFALAVVNPEAGNLGGSGFMLLRRPDGELAALDYRSQAPRMATPDMFAGEDMGRPHSSELGHRAVAVPGAVRGLWDAHCRFGSMSWPELVDPAVSLARGFRVTSRLIRSYEPHIVEGLSRFPGSARVFLPGGAPPREGEIFVQSDLAGTLGRIRDHGAAGFYGGRTADLLVDEMRRGGGLVSHEDLASYTPSWREPVRCRYREHTLVSMPPSSSGGVTLAAMSRILSGWGLGRLPWHGTEHIHLLVESWRRAYADRNHDLADPEHIEISLETLLSREYGMWRARDVVLDRASRSEAIGPGVQAFLALQAGEEKIPSPPVAPPREGDHTTHVSIVAPTGDAVSLTTTLNTWYGSKVVAEGTGVLLNNEMDDFTTRPGVPNHFGLIQGKANRIAPGKRMLSAMTPTLVLGPRGALAMVVGTPGGSTITTTVHQVVTNVVDHGMSLADAVAAPRVHHQHLPDVVEIEPAGLRPEVAEALRNMGHTVRERAEPWGDVQAVAVLSDGSLQAAADPRRGGVALGF